MVSFCQDDDDKGKEVLDWARFDLVIQRFMVIIFSMFRIFMTATTKLSTTYKTWKREKTIFNDFAFVNINVAH